MSHHHIKFACIIIVNRYTQMKNQPNNNSNPYTHEKVRKKLQKPQPSKVLKIIIE